MLEVENKFIIMSRIAVALRSKGVRTNVYLNGDYCALMAHFGEDGEMVESIDSLRATEAELLEWWSTIEGESA